MALKNGRRGSTFLLVLAMLSILVLIAAALSYNSRLEGRASQNFAELTQARMAANTGLPAAMPLLTPLQGLVSSLQPWYQAPLVMASLQGSGSQRQNSSLQPILASAGGITSKLAGKTNPSKETRAAISQSPAPNAPAVFTISDLSSRVNVNTINNQHTFQRFLEAVVASTSAKGLSLSGSLAQSQSVFHYRGTQPGTTSTLQPDLRKEVQPGTRRFESISQMRSSGNNRRKSMFQDKEVAALSGFMTVFSQSPEYFNLPDGTSIPKVSLTGLTVQKAFDALHRAFPDKDSRLLMQYAVNIVDFADADDLPSTFSDTLFSQPWNTILGYEQSPLITEVYPDAQTSKEFEDAGQFLEIYNPWDRPISLDQWRVAIGGLGTHANSTEPAGAGSDIALSGVLPPGGYLVITDNYDQPDDKSPPESGSLVSIFGTKKDDHLRRVITNAALNLPDANSFVSLTDNQGNLIDIFSYTDVAGTDSKTSYQRDDPRVRAFSPSEGSPFDKPEQGFYTGNEIIETAMREAWQSGNAGISNITDLLRVSTAYKALLSQEQGTKLQAHAWQYPVLTQESIPSNLDVHVLDLFSTLPPKESTLADQPQTETMVDPQLDRLKKAGFGAVVDAHQSRLRTKALNVSKAVGDATTVPVDYQTTGVLFSYGKLNINTCSKIALLSLDATVDGQQYFTPELIEKIEKYRMERLESRKVPFENVSDLLVHFFPQPGEREIRAFGKLAEQVTVSSSAFEIVAENRVSEADRNSKRTPSVVRERWMVALDTPPYSLIQYSIER